MSEKTDFDVIIIGGGLAGLTSAIHLSKNNLKILLVEKYQFPHHKVCGEYISNEIIPYLNELDIFPLAEGAKNITQFEITTNAGKSIHTKLPLGGFGMSRYALDLLLYKKAIETSSIIIDTVTEIHFSSEIFRVETSTGKNYTTEYVLGAFGKRSNLDIKLNRNFIKQKSPWLAVKAHYEYDMPENKVALHNFEGGYCGLSKIETGAVNACYLTTFNSFKKHNDIDEFQKQEMSKNPHLEHFFNTSKMLFEKPLTISQVSFQNKKPVENHIIMIGDSAGLIHPLCGNGMAMAIHSAKLFSEIFIQHKDSKNRKFIEETYAALWQKTFSSRMKTGSLIQRLLLKPTLANVAFKAAKSVPSILPHIIKRTHGNVTI
ncbi:MAG: NAD(P)/FAD-dependent oxidoreductase [Patiriisocius sp.]|uniref:NAD(P)/FAD-dependent oxidoreductase n=1 Tax=Patiriisocius sp. TaxID=2822396 RepID=UPI003EF7EA09